MKNNKQKTIWILVGVVSLTFVLVGVYGYSFYKVKETSENASLVSDELNEYLSKEGTINILKTSVRDTEEERKKINTYFVARDDIPDFARKIEALGEMSGTDLDITGLRKQGDVLLFDLSSDGGFQNTMQLISLIESLPFKVEIMKAYIDVVETEISEEEGGGTRRSWNGNFSIELTGFIAKQLSR